MIFYLRPLARLVVLISLILLSAGCIYLPVTSKEKGFDEVERNTLVLSETTRQQVREQFGDPLAEFERGSTWIYSDEGLSARWLFLGFGMTPFALTEREEETYFLQLDFRADDTLLDSDIARIKSGKVCSASGVYSAHGLSVLASQHANADAITFVAPPERCAVYLYAEKLDQIYLYNIRGDALSVKRNSIAEGYLINEDHFSDSSSKPEITSFLRNICHLNLTHMASTMM